MVPGTDPWSGRAADGPHDADGGESESGDGPGRYQLEADGTIAAVSDGLLALTGYERSGLLGEHVSTLLSGEDPDRYEVAMGRLHSDGQLPATDVAVTLRTADGDPLPCSIRVVALAGDDDWASVGLVSPCDGSAAVEPPPGVGAVTEVLNATADVGVLLVDETGTIRWANETAADYFGRDPASLVGMDRRDVETTVPTPDSGEETGDHVADAIGRSAHLDESGRDGSAAPDVETRLVERRCTGITDGPLSGGRLEVYHDVTERKRDPRRVQLYASIVENAGHVGFTMDADGTLTYMSPQVEELIDVDHRELVGKSVAELAELTVATAAERDQVRRHVEQLLQRGDEPKQFEVTMETDRRGEHVVEMVLQPLGQDGDVEMVVGTARDVTERVEQRIELQRERYLNELLFETAPVGIMVVEPDGTIIRANERVKTIVGIDDRDVTGLDYTTLEYTLWTPDGEALPPAECPTRRVIESRTAVFGDECRLVRPDGTERWVMVNAAAIVDRNDELDCVVTILTDTTEQHERAERLRTERAFLNAFLAALPDLVYAYDTDWQLTRFSDSIPSVTGYDPEELDGKDLLSFIPDDEVDDIADAVTDIIEHGTRRRIESELETKDGERIPYEYSGAPIIDDDGNVLGLAGVGRDISERKAREQRLHEQRRSIETIVGNSPVVLFAVDDEGVFTRSEGLGLERIDMEPTDAVGRSVYDLYAGNEEVIDVVDRALDGEEVHETVEANGVIFDTWNQPIYDDHGDVEKVVGFALDITDRVRRERTLSEQNDRLERLNRINAVIRDIDQVLVRASSREEIEAAVCERLAAAERYRYAWIGRERQTDRTVVPEAVSGPAETILEEVTIRTDADPADAGPVGRAFRTREIQVCQDLSAVTVSDDSDVEPALCGQGSLAAIPIVYEDTMYGVLSVGADRPNGFGAMEQTVLAELGETIGHAISGLQAKRALMSEEVTEMTVSIHLDGGFLVELADEEDTTVTFEGVTTDQDGTVSHYMAVEGVDPERVRAFASEYPVIDGVRIVTRYEGSCVVEFDFAGTSLYETISEQGGSVRDAHVRPDGIHATLELPSSTDTREVLDALRTRFGDVSLDAQRKVERSIKTRHQFRAVLIDRLTDRQHAALQTAYSAGYFDWPRESTGEDVAETMDVSPPAFHKHLRLAERLLVGAVLGDEPLGGG